MNVAFHTIASIATAAALNFESGKIKGSSARFVAFRCAVGFLINILIHGVLDFLPHEYPLRASFDILLALFLLAIVFALVQKQNRLLLIACFLGGIFPDLFDLGPAVLSKYFGVPLFFPNKIFPWHWKEFSGSIYDGSRRIESMLFHVILLALSSCLLYFNRKQFFNFGKLPK